MAEPSRIAESAMARDCRGNAGATGQDESRRRRESARLGRTNLGLNSKIITIHEKVDLGEVQYDQFVVPSCGQCEKEGIQGSIVKPNVVFFGETITEEVKDRS